MSAHVLRIESVSNPSYAALLHQIDGGDSSNWTENSYASHLERGITYLAWRNEQAVGFIAAQDVIDCMEILNFCVLKHLRKLGFGALLLQRLMDDYRDRQVILECRESNLAALALYRKFHFQDYNLRKAYYADGENAILMKKQGF